MYDEYDERCQIKNNFEIFRNSPLGFSHGDNLFDRNYQNDSNEIFEDYDSFGRTPDLNSNPRATQAQIKHFFPIRKQLKKVKKKKIKNLLQHLFFAEITNMEPMIPLITMKFGEILITH